MKNAMQLRALSKKLAKESNTTAQVTMIFPAKFSPLFSGF